MYSNTNSREIIVLNEDQTIVKSLKTKIKLEFMCMAGYNGLFISDGKSIKHMTENGSISRIPYTLKRDNEITGLDVDEQGQLYACTSNKENGTVVRINTTTGYKEPILENLIIVEKNPPKVPGALERMAGASNIKWCEPCSRDGENQPADSWCSDCNEPLCVECAKFHRKGKITANHKTIPILEAEKLDSTILDISESCHIHDDQTLSFFCVQHDTICCAFCLRESHNACKNVQSIENASKGVKMGTAIDDLQRRISDFSLIVGRIVEIYRKNLNSISEKKKELKETFRNVQKDLNTYLDDLERVIDNNLNDCDKECKDEIEKNIKDLTTRKSRSDSWQTAIEMLTEHASETRIFAAVKTIDNLQVKEETFLSKMQENLTAFELRSPPCDFMEKIKPILITLSEVKIEKIKITVQLPINVQQVQAYKFQQEKALLVQKISCSLLKMPTLSKNCFTVDDRIVCSGQPIHVYDMTRSSVKTVKVSFISTDVTCDLKNNIYASFPSVGISHIDTMKSREGFRRMNKIMSKSGEYQWVKLHNDLIYSNTSEGIVLLNKEGTVVKTVICTITPTFVCLEKCGGIYISNGKSIIHITESGEHNEIPTNLKTEYTITGMDVDRQRQLYACICNDEEGSVVRINTTTGYKEPILGDLVTPSYIAFHPTKNMFLVTTDYGKECSVYQVTN
ncbi:unnamed protein product [Mytilus coruscus]|uniref:B box-type domain-containing protein n=1 Tax=Mytilus coruscus TaxID=42192 RepID=A0A6J8D0J4_MYTCO|nr:unnamed protein product [Mytilus coruscus]